MTTAWVLGPDRGLTNQEKERVEDWPKYEPVPTFVPEMISDPTVREKVNSSAYGEKIPAPRPPAEEIDIVEERQKHIPDMNCSEAAVALRQKINSHAYGEKTPEVRAPVEAPQPTFTPEIVRSKEGEKLIQVAVSTHYGTVIPAPPAIREPELPSFRPDLNVSHEAALLREKAPSHKYGVEVPAVRPQTAPASSDRPHYERMYTLLEDRSDKPERPKSPEFILDATRAAHSNHNLVSPFKAKPLPGFHDGDKRSGGKEATRSSNYGKVTPEVKKKINPILLSESLCSPVRNLDVAAWNIKVERLHELELDTLPERPNVLSKEPSSSGYGQVSPTKGDRLSVSTEPFWAPIATPVPPVKVEDLPPPPKNKLNESVNSTKYGQDSPQKVPREEFETEPVWVPATMVPKELPALGSPPRTRKSEWQHIGSHYGAGYTPARSSPADGHFREATESSPQSRRHGAKEPEDESY